ASPAGPHWSAKVTARRLLEAASTSSTAMMRVSTTGMTSSAWYRSCSTAHLLAFADACSGNALRRQKGPAAAGGAWWPGGHRRDGGEGRPGPGLPRDGA